MSLTSQSMNGAYIFSDNQRSCGKVMFSQGSVILFGVCMVSLVPGLFQGGGRVSLVPGPFWRYGIPGGRVYTGERRVYPEEGVGYTGSWENQVGRIHPLGVVRILLQCFFLC